MLWGYSHHVRGGGSNADPSPSIDAQAATIKVQKGDLTPTLSARTQAYPGENYALLATGKGIFIPSVEKGQKVAKGDVIGTINSTKVQAPAASTIVAVLDTQSEVPQNYPVATLRYEGFTLPLDLNPLVSTVGLAPLIGKFQLTDGPGPADCEAVVFTGINVTQVSTPSSNTNADEGSNTQGDPNLTPAPANAGSSADESANTTDGATTNMNEALSDTDNADSQSTQGACLIPTSIVTRSGQSGLTVISAKLRSGVLLLPLTSVAGRTRQGSVLKREGNGLTQTDVELGATDGALIEIKSGLNEGDEVSETAPYLDPRFQ